MIDGRLDDAAWQTAPVMKLVVHDATKGENPAVKFPTEVRMVWTLDGVTLGYRMTEPNPQQLVRNIRSNDDPLAYWQDNVEFFFDVTGRNAGDWYQFLINAAGAVHDGHKTDVAWDAAGLKTASFTGPDYWSLEVYLPLSAFPDAVRPGTGAVWYGQFIRHRVAHASKSVPGRENQKLNAQFGGFNSNVADFAPVRFEE